MSTLQVDVVWPDLPLPALDYNATPRNQTISSHDADLLVERRSRFTRSYNGLAVTWTFNTAQLLTFKTFCTDTLCNCCNWFKIELRFPLNSALTEWAARIDGGFQANYVEGIWTIQATLDLISPITY